MDTPFASCYQDPVHANTLSTQIECNIHHRELDFEGNCRYCRFEIQNSVIVDEIPFDYKQ
jgi:hypothetical protein